MKGRFGARDTKFALDHMTQKGFYSDVVPLLVRNEAMYGTGYFPWGKKAYRADKDELN